MTWIKMLTGKKVQLHLEYEIQCSLGHISEIYIIYHTIND